MATGTTGVVVPGVPLTGEGPDTSPTPIPTAITTAVAQRKSRPDHGDESALCLPRVARHLRIVQSPHTLCPTMRTVEAVSVTTMILLWMMGTSEIREE